MPTSSSPGRRRLSRLALILALLTVPAILLASGQLLINDFARTRALREEVDQSFRRRAQLQTVLSLLQDVETGQRGYLLTGDRRFLDPERSARPRIAQELGNLEELLGPQPQLQELERLSAAKIEFAERTIKLRGTGREDEAAQLVASGRGRRIMDDIRTLLAELDGHERAQLDRRVELMQKVSSDSHRLVIALHVFLVLLLAAAALMVSRTLAARRRALADLHDLSMRQAAIFQEARDGIVILDDDGHIERANSAAAGMYLYSPEELHGRDVGLLFEMNMDAGSRDSFRTRRRRSGSGGGSGLVHELWGRRRHGSSFPIDVSISPIQLEDGTRYLAIIRDVTERNQMEQMTTDFVSTVSHELRTPLTSIAGSLGLIAGGAAGQLPDRAMRLVEIAKNNAERLVRLINDILDIEKIESGAILFDVRPTLLKPVVETAIEANRAFAASHGVTLGLSGGFPEDACVLADADGLTQVLTNLISNAAKFSPEGKRVQVSVKRQNGHFRISVADRGPGIPEEFRERIFEKFTQADSSDTRGKGGTGLGLSIAREIVARLEGSIGFEDRDGGGTVFHVDLPAAAAEGSAKGKAAEGEVPRILHVDDDPLIRRLVAKGFSGRADIQYAPTLAAARSFLAEAEFDLAILDLSLPDGSGLSLLPDLRKDGRTPVILFSARDLEREEARLADAIVPKSHVTIDQLVEAATALIETRHDRKAA